MEIGSLVVQLFFKLEKIVKFLLRKSNISLVR